VRGNLLPPLRKKYWMPLAADGATIDVQQDSGTFPSRAGGPWLEFRPTNRLRLRLELKLASETQGLRLFRRAADGNRCIRLAVLRGPVGRRTTEGLIGRFSVSGIQPGTELVPARNPRLGEPPIQDRREVRPGGITMIDLLAVDHLAWMGPGRVNPPVERKPRPEKFRKPTAEGKRRYPPDGYRGEDGSLHSPCTCLKRCPDPCLGSAASWPDGKDCKCKACAEAYGDSTDDSDRYED
jgi:hypothetical protein